MPGVFYVIGQMVLIDLVQRWESADVMLLTLYHVVSLCLVDVMIDQTAYMDA